MRTPLEFRPTPPFNSHYGKKKRLSPSFRFPFSKAQKIIADNPNEGISPTENFVSDVLT